MPQRFTATKADFELKSISELQTLETPILVKADNDFKAIGFNVIWEREDLDKFKLTCYCKGVFTANSKEFKSLAKDEPLLVVNSTLYKELFTFVYNSQKDASDKDVVSTEELQFVYTDFFEDEEVLFFYLQKLSEAFNWKLENKNLILDKWELFPQE
jgi:hypothetical protein